MAEPPKLTTDLQQVIQEMSKAPGGNVAQPRPVTPGPILGGPVESKPGLVDPATGVRTKRDPAIELFRFYAYGEEKQPRFPAPPPDTKTITVTEQELTKTEKAKRKAAKEAGRTVLTSNTRKAINQAVRQGTIGGMTRAPGSKPPPHLAKNLPIIMEVAAERARRAAEANIIRDALEKAATADYTGRILSRDEQKYLDLLRQRIQDAVMQKEAAQSWREFWRGERAPTLEEVRAMQEADKRTLEGRQVAERTRQSRQKTETSLVDKSKPPVTPRAPIGAIPPIMPGGGGLLDMTK